jgi:hypothetical protein
MLDLSKEKVLLTLKNYEKIMDRVKEVVEEIGFTNSEYDTLNLDETEFTEDSVYIDIPDSVTSIGSYAFYNVPHITYSGSATGYWGALAKN